MKIRTITSKAATPIRTPVAIPDAMAAAKTSPLLKELLSSSAGSSAGIVVVFPTILALALVVTTLAPVLIVPVKGTTVGFAEVEPAETATLAPAVDAEAEGKEDFVPALLTTDFTDPDIEALSVVRDATTLPVADTEELDAKYFIVVAETDEETEDTPVETDIEVDAFFAFVKAEPTVELTDLAVVETDPELETVDLVFVVDDIVVDVVVDGVVVVVVVVVDVVVVSFLSTVNCLTSEGPRENFPPPRYCLAVIVATVVSPGTPALITNFPVKFSPGFSVADINIGASANFFVSTILTSIS